MLRALFPGSFDPPTLGHINIIERSSRICDALHIVVANNLGKQYVFNAEERRIMLSGLVVDFSNVWVHIWDKLIVECANKLGVSVMIRGVRAMEDFEHEFQLSMINKGLDSSVETIFMPTDPQFFVLRSSAIKELARLGGDVSSMVPEAVIEPLLARLGPTVQTST